MPYSSYDHPPYGRWKYGKRLIAMKDGHIVQDLNQEEKAQMAIADTSIV